MIDEKLREIARKAFWDGLPCVYGADECIDEAIEAYEQAKGDNSILKDEHGRLTQTSDKASPAKATEQRAVGDEVIDEMCRIYWTTPSCTKFWDDLDSVFKGEMRSGMIDVFRYVATFQSPAAPLTANTNEEE